MHIAPGVVESGQLWLGYITAGGSLLLAGKMITDTVARDGGVKALLLRSIATTAAVLVFFQIFPHYTRGISEVHFIFGPILYLLFGSGAAAVGLALGLLLQGLVFAPADLPQYFMNATTLIVPLFLVTRLVKMIVRPHAPYVSTNLWQAFVISAAYQGGIILLVAFWALYGGGFGAENLGKIGLFAGNYLVVIIVEPLVAMGVLAAAKFLDPVATSPVFYSRLHHPVS